MTDDGDTIPHAGKIVQRKIKISSYRFHLTIFAIDKSSHNHHKMAIRTYLTGPYEIIGLLSLPVRTTDSEQLATEITARFKDSITHFDEDQTNVAMLAWLPEHLIYGKPQVIGTWVDTAKSVAAARDLHYHRPPDYIVFEPEDTIRPRGLAIFNRPIPTVTSFRGRRSNSGKRRQLSLNGGRQVCVCRDCFAGRGHATGRTTGDRQDCRPYRRDLPLPDRPLWGISDGLTGIQD